MNKPCFFGKIQGKDTELARYDGSIKAVKYNYQEEMPVGDHGQPENFWQKKK